MFWPTRDKLYVFDQHTAQPRKVIDLAVRGAAGGNLLVADGRLLIATERELIAIDPHTKPRRRLRRAAQSPIAGVRARPPVAAL